MSTHFHQARLKPHNQLLINTGVCSVGKASGETGEIFNEKKIKIS